MNLRYTIVAFIALLFTPAVFIAQSNKQDSVLAILKTAKEDTDKVNKLNMVCSHASGADNGALADSLNKLALALAEKLNYKKGLGEAYINNGIVCEDKGDFPGTIKKITEGLEICKQLNDKTYVGFAYMSLGRAYCVTSNVPEALKYLNLALALYQEIGDKGGLASIYGALGNVYLTQSEYSDALINYLKNLALAQETGSKHGMASAYGNIGLIYFYENDYPNALKNNLLALKLNEELKDKDGMSNAYGNIGQVYDQLHNYPAALKNDSMSLKLNEETGNKIGIESGYGCLGNVFEDEGNYTEALKNMANAIKFAQETGSIGDLCSSYGNTANIYYAMGNYPEALNAVMRSKAIANKVGDKYSLANVFITMSKIYIKQKKYAEADRSLDSTIKIANSIGAKDINRDAYLTYAALDSSTGNFSNAFKYYKLYITYRDSLSNEINTKKIVTEQMTYDFEKKQAEAKAEQDKKDVIQREKIKKQKYFTYGVTAGLLLVLLLAAIIFRSLQLSKKKNQTIIAQKVEVEEKNKLIEDQKSLVEQKNREVLDSIVYAKRLQDAILPPIRIIKSYLPDSFVLYKPKDIVAGDFYWMEHTGDSILIAACDCTGHGVPGALVSVVCSNALNRTVKEFKITQPGKILDKVRELVLETFEKSESEVMDGMDVSLCCINTKTAEIQWSGAYNPLWYVQNNEFKEIAPDKQPIGVHDNAKPFNTHCLTLQKGDILYLFTDGYADQFGGPKGKKFKYKQLQELLLANTTQAMELQGNLLNKTIESWKGDLEQVDDVLVIGIRV